MIGPDPTTHKHAKNVYAHFHVHADNADLLSHRCGGQTVATAVAATSTKEAAGFSSSSARGAGAALRPASAPSMGDIAAWLCYHRNQPRAFILTRDACWLLFKCELNRVVPARASQLPPGRYHHAFLLLLLLLLPLNDASSPSHIPTHLTALCTL